MPVPISVGKLLSTFSERTELSKRLPPIVAAKSPFSANNK